MKFIYRIAGQLLLWGVLLLIMLALLSPLTLVRLDTLPYNVSTKVEGFFAEEEDTLDVVFIGTSGTYFGVNPSLLWREYGIPSYTFASSEQPAALSYLYVQEAIARQHPQVIALDVHPLRYTADYATNAVHHIGLDGVPLSLNKLEAIFLGTPSAEWLDLLFPAIKYHGSQTYNQRAFSPPQPDPYLGYSPYFESLGTPYTFGQWESVTACAPLNSRAEGYFRKIIALCRQENVQLVLYKIPSMVTEDEQQRLNEIKRIAQEEQIPYLDFNTVQWIELSGYDARYDVADSVGHSNYLGAEKITRALGDYLISSLSLRDRRGEAAYASWEEKTSAYYADRAAAQPETP